MIEKKREIREERPARLTKVFFSSRRRHTRYWRDWIQTCALPIWSNIMFSALHAKACTILGLSIPVVFAAQSAGGALGNMICTNNVVAACTTVGLKNSEGIVMRKVFKPICILWTLYAVLALIYVYILLPNLPVVLK